MAWKHEKLPLLPSELPLGVLGQSIEQFKKDKDKRLKTLFYVLVIGGTFLGILTALAVGMFYMLRSGKGRALLMRWRARRAAKIKRAKSSRQAAAESEADIPLQDMSRGAQSDETTNPEAGGVANPAVDINQLAETLDELMSRRAAACPAKTNFTKTADPSSVSLYPEVQTPVPASAPPAYEPEDAQFLDILKTDGHKRRIFLKYAKYLEARTPVC